jgi:hypothetical protein
MYISAVDKKKRKREREIDRVEKKVMADNK